MNGKGILTYSDDGSNYEGKWKDGKKHGRHIFTDSSGNKTTEFWNEGKQVTSFDDSGSNNDSSKDEYNPQDFDPAFEEFIDNLVDTIGPVVQAIGTALQKIDK